MTHTTQATSNKLKKVFLINNKKANCEIVVQLADDCKNGHEDFSVTGTFWEIGKVRNDRNMYAGGCCHDEILELMPELEIFVQLHLSDFNGYPMHFISNLYYHLNNNPEKVCEYYNLSQNQFKVIEQAHSETHLAYLLFTKSDIITTYNERAKKAIAILEDWIGLTFKSNATKSQLKEYDFKQYENKSIEQVQQEEQEKKQQYETIKFNKHLQDITEKAKKEIEKINFETSLKLAIAEIIGTTNNNFIFYNHSNKLVFNWQDYGQQFTFEQVAKFTNEYENSNNIEISIK